MSSYWAGYAGTALVLSNDEFQAMMKAYREKNPKDMELLEAEHGYDYNTDYDRAELLRSAFHGKYTRANLKPEENTDKYTSPVMINDSCCDGATLTPFYINGKKNVTEYNQQHEPTQFQQYTIFPDETVWAFFSDKAMNGVDAFDEKPYASYQDFVQEFKDKLQTYLPHHFDWDNHIGYFTYACYA